MNRSRATFVALAIAALASLSFASDRALKAAINGPHQLAFDSFGNLYVSEEYGNRVLRLDPTMANVTVIAGNGHQCCRKENVPARESSVYAVSSIAVDGHGNVYIGGRNARDGAFVRIVHAATGKIETLARGGFPAAALSAKSSDANLSDPRGIVVTPEGKVLVSADESHVVVELGRGTQLVAGTQGQKGFLGDGGPASLARFDLPGAMAVDGMGNVFVADFYNHRVRRIDAQTGMITTVAGNGSDVSSGDGGIASAAGVHHPYALAVDSVGNLFVVENGTFRVRKVDAISGAIQTVAGTGNSGFSGDGGPATHADMNPTGVAVDRHGNLYISDIEHNRIRRVDSATGIVSTVAGNGLPHRKVIIE